MSTSKTEVWVDIKTILPLGRVPVEAYDKSTATAVPKWSRCLFHFKLDDDELDLLSGSVYVTPCTDNSYVRFLTVHSEPMTLEALTVLHSKFCATFDGEDQRIPFEDWSRSDFSRLYTMNRVIDSAVVSFSVHRTYKDSKPWFVAIESG